MTAIKQLIRTINRDSLTIAIFKISHYITQSSYSTETSQDFPYDLVSLESQRHGMLVLRTMSSGSVGELSLTIITMLTFPSSLWLTAGPAGHCIGVSTKAPSVPLHPSSCLSGAASSQAVEEVKGPGDSLAESHHGGRGAGGAGG